MIADLEKIEPEKVLGVFVEPVGELTKQKKSPSFLSEVIAACKSKGIPVIFSESASAWYQFSSDHFFCVSSELKPDGIVWYSGGQLGIVAVQKELFLDKPLQMISTWDGDEHSLNLLADRILRESH